jgi:tRNA-dihydrouridine synthase 1
MDDLPLVQSLVEKLASNLSVPVSCKIRMFPALEDTLAYARMLEKAGCSLLAVHGRTRDQKDGKAIRADWSVIKAVKEALSIPVLANGNIRYLDDVYECMKETGADGVLSAESLLHNPALFAGYQVASDPVSITSEDEDSSLDQTKLLLEYLELLDQYPVPMRMVRAHVHRMLGNWFQRHPDIREELNKEFKLSKEFLHGIVQKLLSRKERIPLLPP